jgi:acetylornithine deacetylase/succinyl-diaminopimelate desuccinylase-like protein
LTEEAFSYVTENELRDTVMAMTSIPSPTGEERELASWLAAEMSAAGLDASLQEIDDFQANAHGRLHGTYEGPDVMLYAPIDTLTTGNADEDIPWIGPHMRPDMHAEARAEGPWVIGLGASNPKGHGACVLEAMRAISRAGIPLLGDVIAGFGAGGMPTNARVGKTGSRRNTGQGVGCSFMLEQGVWADFAVIAKPGWTVSWEEVGLAWFEIAVSGIHTYVGSRHRLPYRNPIADAAYVVERLEAFFEQSWAPRHESGLVRPQGIVSAIEAGWTRMLSVTPAECRIFVDMRLSPRTTPSQARRELARELSLIAEEREGMVLTMRPLVSIPGTTTDPGSPVIKSAIAAWEDIEGRPHEVIYQTSGATDANILRNRGIPTARIGMPKVTDTPFEVDFQMGMNTVDTREMMRLTKALIEIAVDLATTPLEELNLERGLAYQESPVDDESRRGVVA